MAGTDSRYACQHPWLKTNNVVGKMGCWLGLGRREASWQFIIHPLDQINFITDFWFSIMGWVRLGCGLCQDDTFGIWDRLIQSVTIHAINEVNDGVIVIWLWLSICWPKSGYFSVYACRCSRVTFVNIDLIYFLFWFFSSIFFLLVICKFWNCCMFYLWWPFSFEQDKILETIIVHSFEPNVRM